MRSSTSLNMIRQNRPKTQLCKVAEYSRRLCMVGARTHLFGQGNTSIPPKPRKRSRGPNRRNTRLLQSHGLLLMVELLVLIFLRLFHFKDKWISKKRPNFDIRLLTTDNFLQKRAYCFAFECLNGTPACFPFKINFKNLMITL